MLQPHPLGVFPIEPMAFCKRPNKTTCFLPFSIFQFKFSFRFLLQKLKSNQKPPKTIKNPIKDHHQSTTNINHPKCRLLVILCCCRKAIIARRNPGSAQPSCSAARAISTAARPPTEGSRPAAKPQILTAKRSSGAVFWVQRDGIWLQNGQMGATCRHWNQSMTKYSEMENVLALINKHLALESCVG